MERILVIGCSGAGKSTFAKTLAAQTGLPLIHLDRIFWQGNWEHLSQPEFDRALQAELEKPRWIIDGDYNRTLPHRLSYCDRVFFFDLPALTCLWGVTRRMLESYGKTRSDMGGTCPERFDRQKLELYRHILTYKRRNRKNFYRLLADSGVQVTVFRSRRQANAYLKSLRS